MSAKSEEQLVESSESVVEPAPESATEQPADAVAAESAELDTESPEHTIAALQEQLAAAEQTAAEARDRAVRAVAEMDNFRKRAERDVANAHKFSLEKIANEILPLRDSMELGLDAASKEGADIETIREGNALTLQMMSSLMEKFQIEPVNPVDQAFDPALHQAMSMQEVPGTAANTVVAVVQKGYTLNGRLLRPALVMVAK